jgi:hypothetical protein
VKIEKNRLGASWTKKCFLFTTKKKLDKTTKKHERENNREK